MCSCVPLYLVKQVEALLEVHEEDLALGGSELAHDSGEAGVAIGSSSVGAAGGGHRSNKQQDMESQCQLDASHSHTHASYRAQSKRACTLTLPPA